jgi:hypothetical protein
MQLELAGQGVGPKHVNKKLGFVLYLKIGPVHVGLASGEKRPLPGDDIAPVRFSRQLYRTQRLKPEFYYALYGPAKARALIRSNSSPALEARM